jgi:hypothetical protein
MAKNQVLLFLTASLVAISCSESDKEPDKTAPMEQPEVLTRDMDTQIAHATKVTPSHVHVDMMSRAGAVVFSADIQPGGPAEQAITWRLSADPALGSAGGALSGALSVPLAQLPELEDAITMTAFTESKVIRSMKGQEYDNWGCDLPFTNVASCSPKGACCDVHDACYARNHCSSSSWWNPFASLACKACNAAVVACIASPVYFPGPSVCCALGNCGTPR